METALESSSISPIGIDSTLLKQLKTYEDYVSFYVQLEEATSKFSWLKADMLYQMSLKFGDKSLQDLANSLREKVGTVNNYVHLAKAFPPEKREPAISFSHHIAASYADSFSTKKQEFEGEKRFEWIAKAAEEELSTRELSHRIQEEKRARLAENNEKDAWKYDASNKATELKSLIDGLMMGIGRGDTVAYDKLLNIYNKVYAQDKN